MATALVLVLASVPGDRTEVVRKDRASCAFSRKAGILARRRLAHGNTRGRRFAYYGYLFQRHGQTIASVDDS